MKDKKRNKYKRRTIEEKNEIALLYLDRHMSYREITRFYNLASSSSIQTWVKQYREFGTCVDRRGQGTIDVFPKKARAKKDSKNLEDLTKEQLIEKVKLYEDIKKSMAYLMSQPSNKNIKS